MAARTSSLVHPRYKTKYSVGNWREYEHGLRARGDVTIWFSEDAIAELRTTASWTFCTGTRHPGSFSSGENRGNPVIVATFMTAAAAVSSARFSRVIW